MSINNNKNLIKACLEEMDQAYIEKGDCFEMIVSLGDNSGISFGRAVISVREDDICLQLSAPFCVPKDRRAVICEYLCLVNFSLLAGSFEIDITNGEVAYKLFQFTTSGIAKGDISRSLLIAKEMIGSYGEGLAKLSFSSDADPMQCFLDKQKEMFEEEEGKAGDNDVDTEEEADTADDIKEEPQATEDPEMQDDLQSDGVW